MSEIDADPGDGRWRRSSYSSAQGNCVEVAYLDGLVAIRDSKDPTGPVLRSSRSHWRIFVGGIARGDLANSPDTASHR